MLFYKAKYEAATPTRVQVNVPTNTDYLIGAELYVKGVKKEIATENVKLKYGNTVVSADTTVNGIPAFTLKSLDEESDKLYDVEFTDGETYDYNFKLFINQTEKDFGVVDAAGTRSVSWDDIQDKPDVLTPSSSEITELDSTVSALTESFGELDSTVSALASSLSSYATKSELTDYLTVSTAASTYATKTELSDYATTSAMESYVDAQIGAVLSSNF